MRQSHVIACLFLCVGAALATAAQTAPATRLSGRAPTTATNPRPSGRAPAATIPPVSGRAPTTGPVARGTSSRPATSSSSRPADVMMTPSTFDPARIRMKIGTFQFNPPKVDAQCIGTLVILNTGPGYEQDPTHVLPYWVLTIADDKGTEIHRAGGSWAGPVKTGESKSLTFDTHSNSVPGAQGKPFFFPRPGKYTVTMSIFPGGDVLTPVDTKPVEVEVPTPK